MTRTRRFALAALVTATLLAPTPAPAAPPCAEDEGVMWSDAGVTCFKWYQAPAPQPEPEPAPEPVDFPVELPRTT